MSNFEKKNELLSDTMILQIINFYSSGLNPNPLGLASASVPSSLPSPVSGIDIAAMHEMLRKHHER